MQASIDRIDHDLAQESGIVMVGVDNGHGFGVLDFFGDKIRSQTKIFYIYFNLLPLNNLYMNHRFDLKRMMVQLGHVVVASPVMPYRILKMAEGHG